MDIKKISVVSVVGVISVIIVLFLMINLINQDTIYVDRTSYYPTDTGGILYNALQFNGENLTDHTVINTSSYCEGYNLGMNISIYPCLTKNRDRNNMDHYVDFTWQGGQARDLSLSLIHI